MNITIFKNITSKDKSAAVEKLITHSTPSQDFFLMAGLAIAMATLGLLLDSSAIIIGSMLISPILYAFLSLSLGLSISDNKLIFRSIISIVQAFVLGVIIATIITMFTPNKELNSEILSRIDPSLAYGMVGFIAGFAAAFTLTKPQLSETLPGIAIAVALIPPIAVIGIGLATLNWIIFRGALLLFLLNTFAVIVGSLIVFLLMNIYAKKNLAKQTLEHEEKKIENEALIKTEPAKN